MKPTYITELLILIFSGIAGMIMSINWIMRVVGIIIISLVSYFLVTKLKKQTIEEYIKKEEIRKLKEQAESNGLNFLKELNKKGGVINENRKRNKTSN